MTALDFSTLSRIAAGGIVNSLLAGVVVAALGLLLSGLAGRHSSRTRFTIWFIALVTIAFLPWAGSLGASRPSAPALPSGALSLPESLASCIFVLWVAGATLGLAHVAHGLYRLRRLKATCTSVESGQLDLTARQSLNAIQPCRRVALCVSSAVRVPAAIGYFGPIVVFPTWVFAEIPPPELNAILLHELAHLRRYDDWTNLAQKLVKAVLFFHPAVWFIESRLTLEREMACDDAVLAASFSPRAYAESLVNLAEKSFLRGAVQLAQSAVGQVKQLKLRLAEILRRDKPQQVSGRLDKPILAAMALVAITALWGIARAPQLVSLHANEPQAALAPTAPEACLRPVSLTYTAGRQSNDFAGHAQPAASRSRRHTVRKPSMMRAGITIAPQAPVDAKQPTMVLSNPPLQLSPAPVLVVLQGEQFVAKGLVLWRITVLRFTPSQQPFLFEGAAKQI